MSKKQTDRGQVLLFLLGMLLLAVLGSVCYRSVRQAVVDNEMGNLSEAAAMGAESISAAIEAKCTQVYTALAGDMDDVAEVEQRLLRIGERGYYVAKIDVPLQAEYVQEAIQMAEANPRQVIVLPGQGMDGIWQLHLVKTISVNGVIEGFACIEMEPERLYTDQTVPMGWPKTADGRYCVLRNADGVSLIPANYSEPAVAVSHSAGEGCDIEWVYETTRGTPERIRKLLAYRTVDIGGEPCVYYVIENYDLVIRPIERIALYFAVLGVAVLLLISLLLYGISRRRREEELLLGELQHEKMLNETMKKQEGLIQKYNHSKTMEVLIGSIAHEFNNLMAPVMLYTDLLKENEAVQREMPEEVEELSSATERCAELAKQLLTYNRQGRMERVLTDYDATYAMNTALSLLDKLIPDNIELQTSICKTVYYIHGQVGSLNQIVMNLGLNAIQAMPQGGRIKIQFGLSVEDERYVRLIVEDNGPGIPKEYQRKIFQPFFTTKQDEDGNGIGLTVVSRLVQEQGGYVRLKTDEKHGTRFIIDLPRVQTPVGDI